MTKIYVGVWCMLPQGPVSRAEWLEAATESQVEAEIARQKSLLPSPERRSPEDLDSYRPERLVGKYTPKQFEATFNNDLTKALNTEEYFIRMFEEPKKDKVYVERMSPEPLLERFDYVKNNIQVPWHRFGKANPNEAERQTVLGDLVDFLRDMLGGPKDFRLAYMLIGERAMQTYFQWNGLPSEDGFNELAKRTNEILKKNGKNCEIYNTEYSQITGHPVFELAKYNDENELEDISTLDAFQALRYMESILEEEKGELQF